MAKNAIIKFIKGIPRSYYFFGIFCLLFTALMIFVEIKNGKFWTNDFKVYYNAATDFFNGKSPYAKAYGLRSGLFKYPPTTLYFFLLLTKFNYFTAQIIHASILLISLIIGITGLHKILFYQTMDDKNKRGLLYLAFVFIAVHLVREFHMGNVNLVLFALFVIGMKAFLSKKTVQLAIVWSLMVILKPIIILAFIPLLFFKQWKTIWTMFCFGIVYLLVPFLHKGLEGGLNLWKEWFAAIDRHGDYIVSENSFKYLAKYYFGWYSDWLPSLIGFLILVGLMILTIQKQKLNPFSFIEWSALFLAFTPNFFVTDTEHFLLSLPLILIILKRLILIKKLHYWLFFVILMLPYSLKSNDLLGKTLSTLVTQAGWMGLANFALILFFCFLNLSTDSKKENPILSLS